MYILALDTAGPVASAAILQDGRIIAQTQQNSVLDHSRVILPITMDMLRSTGLTLSQIDGFAVVCGPGSFTGVRIGVSAIKGFAWAADKPAFGISTLEAMAYCTQLSNGLLCATLAARENEAFCGTFDMHEGVITRLEPDFCGDFDQIRLKYANYISIDYHHATGAAKCAYKLFQEGIKPSCHEIEPIYLKQTQAERMKEERERLL